MRSLDVIPTWMLIVLILILPIAILYQYIRDKVGRCFLRYSWKDKINEHI